MNTRQVPSALIRSIIFPQNKQFAELFFPVLRNVRGIPILPIGCPNSGCNTGTGSQPSWPLKRALQHECTCWHAWAWGGASATLNPHAGLLTQVIWWFFQQDHISCQHANLRTYLSPFTKDSWTKLPELSIRGVLDS